MAPAKAPLFWLTDSVRATSPRQTTDVTTLRPKGVVDSAGLIIGFGATAPGVSVLWFWAIGTLAKEITERTHWRCQACDQVWNTRSLRPLPGLPSRPEAPHRPMNASQT